MALDRAVRSAQPSVMTGEHVESLVREYRGWRDVVDDLVAEDAAVLAEDGFGEKPVVGKRSREWIAVGPIELRGLQETARCLVELPEGRWPT